MLTYLLLTASAGFIEIGVLIYALETGVPIWLLPAIAATYQVSNYAQGPFRPRPLTCLFLSLGSLVLGFLMRDSVVTLVGYTVSISWAIQGARDALKKGISISRTLKRAVRLIGFICSFMYGWKVAVVVLAGVGIAGATLSFGDSTGNIRNKWGAIETGWLSSLMLLHQVHYFAYYFMMPAYFHNRYGLPWWALSLTFPVGWVSYIVAHYVWRSTQKWVFVVGHFVSFVCIIGLVVSHNLWLSLLWWFLTGFGGGTIYVLRNWSRSLKWEQSLDFWETCGHVIGPFLVIAPLLSGGGVEVAMVFAGIMALIVALSAMAEAWRPVSE